MRGSVASTAIVAAVALAALVPNHPAGRVPSEDAGVFFYAARELLAGGVPYRDVWDHKPPLIYAFDAIGLALAGPLGVWLLQLAALVTAAIVGLRTMTRAFGAVSALAGSLAWLLAAPRLFLVDGQQTSYVEFLVLPLAWTALLVATRHADLRLTRRDALLLGVLAAGALLLKPTLVGTWLAIALVAFWWRRRDAILPLACMAAAAAATVAVVAAYFAARGALGDLVEQAFRYNVGYASFAPPLERLGAIPEGLRLVLPSGLALVALAAWGWAVTSRVSTLASRGATHAPPGRSSPLLVIAVVALPVELLLATSGRGYHYYFLPWLPAMSVLAAFAARELLDRVPRRSALALLAAALVVMSIQPARLVVRLAALGDDGTSRAAAAYIAARSGPEDRVLIWGARTEVLVLAERRSPTRFVYQYAPLATRGYATAAAIDALLADLRAYPPVLIIDASRSSFVTPPLDAEGLRAWGSPEPQYAWPAETMRIVEYVVSAYERVGEIEGAGWPVWRRR